MKSPVEARPAIARGLLSLLTALTLWAGCHLGQEGEKEQVFSMTALADTLGTFDSVKVALLGTGGDTVDVLFHGKVRSESDLADRPAPHYRGGEAILSIVGYDDDTVVYRVDRAWDGRSRSLGDIEVHATARTSIRPKGPAAVEMTVGDSLLLPDVDILPADLSDKRYTWTSSQPGIVALGGAGYKALTDGRAELKASLTADPSRSGSFTVVVKPRSTGIPAVSLDLPDDTLILSVNGGARRLKAVLAPINADPDLAWETPDGTVLRVQPDGTVEGLSSGLGRVVASARLNPAARDTAWVEVKAEVKVTGIAFEKDAVALFVNGAPESLAVRVLPPEADQAVDFAWDETLVRVRDNKVYGLAKGVTTVTATSRKDPSFKDELQVTLSEPEVVRAVHLSQDTATLYAGGETLRLQAAIDPATSNQGVRWSSSRSDLATVDTLGVVRGLKPGLAIITAVSRLDGTKSASCAVTVKEDAPSFSINGNDTVVAIRSLVAFNGRADQAHGRIVRFEWVVEGDTAQSGHSDAVKPVSIRFASAGEFRVSFILDDSEGNRTTVVKKVIVVDGPVINIRSPLNNSITNRTVVDVVWTVDDTVQSTGLLDTLEPGPNTITRTYKGANGIPWSRSISVTLDTEAPLAPIVSSTTPTRLRTPTWTWTTGGRGGHGLFRWRLDNADLSSASPARQTAFLPPAPLAEGPHTLYVQERDSAGNWSDKGRFEVIIDVTGPAKPVVTSPAARTSDASPTWSWTSGGGGNGTFRWVLGAFDTTKATVTTQTSHTPTALAEGSHTLHVQERDTLGNWSEPGSFAVVVDLSGPVRPTVTSAAAVTNDPTPTWTWTAGGGGNGSFRWMLGAFDTTKATATTLRSYTPAALGEGTYTLHVQERDVEGNWSEPGSFAVRIDLTRPPAPNIAALRSPLNTLRPAWSWTAGGAGGNGVYRSSLNDTDMSAAGAGGTLTAFTPATDLAQGTHTLYVQARDSAGNWSARAAREVTLVRRDTLGILPIRPARTLDYAVCPDGTHWVVYVDTTRSNRLSAARFAQDRWQDFGLGFSEFAATSAPSVACDGNGIVYAAYQGSLVGQVYYSANGAAWSQAGNSISEAASITLAVQELNRIPFIVYGDRVGFLKGAYLPGANPAGTWTALPAIGASALYSYPNSWFHAGANALGELHLVFLDRASSSSSRIRMLKLANFSSTSWTSLSVTGLPDSASGMSLAFATTGASANLPQLAVAHQGTINHYLYSASGWSAQGGTVGSGDQVSLSIHAGVPYIAFPDKAANNRAALRVRSGTGWVGMSGTGLSGGAAESVTAANHPTTGFPFVAFIEVGTSRRATVAKTSYDP